MSVDKNIQKITDSLIKQNKEFTDHILKVLKRPKTEKGDYDNFYDIFQDLRNGKIDIDIAHYECNILVGVVIDEVSSDNEKFYREREKELKEQISNLEKENNKLK